MGVITLFKNLKEIIMSKKKILATLCVTAMAIPLSIGLVGCKKDKDKSNDFHINAKEVYALSAVSSVNYLLNLDNTSATVFGAEATSRPAYITDANVENIKNCLKLFDNYIQNGGITQKTVKNTETSGQTAQYNFVMTISLPNLNESIKMYYDEIKTETNVEIEDETEEIETSTTLKGLMLVGENAFDVVGKREFEVDGDETESSIEFTTKSKMNNQNYVTISQSVEQESGEHEIEYEYEIYQNGRKIQEFETEIENENNKIEVEFKLKNVTSGMFENVSFKITKTTIENQFLVNISVNNTRDVITVLKQSEGYTFTYSNGYIELK